MKLVVNFYTNLNQYQMNKLTYYNLATKQAIESWTFTSRQLCIWKRDQLKASGNYSQGFKIEKV